MFRDRDGWRVQWREPDGRRRSRKFHDKISARRFELELELGVASVAPAGRTSPSFEAWAKTWLETVCRTEKAPTQWVKDEEVIRRHLTPAFGGMRLSGLRKAHLLQLKSDLVAKTARGKTTKLSKKTANLVLSLAKRIMQTAVDYEHVAQNPFAGVKLYRLSEKPTVYWSAFERDLFLGKAEALDPEFTRLVTVAVHTGLRLGELAALTRACLNFERRTVLVSGSYSVALQETSSTKGKEIGLVPMNGAVILALEPKRFLRPDDWVFDRALFWSARKRLGRLARKVGVPEIRFHDLRHTFASLLAEEGVSLLQIQRLLRHKSPQMTLRYAKVSHQSLAGVTDLLCRPARKEHANEGQ